MENPYQWEFNERDEAIARSLAEFIPAKVFDIHVHLYQTRDIIPGNYDLYRGGADIVSRDVWMEHQEKQLGTGKLSGGLFVANVVCELEAENQFLFEHLREHPGAKGLLGVRPTTPTREIEARIGSWPIAGFKPFCTFSGLEPPYQAPMHAFVPEWMWEMADHYKWMILVHLVRDQALADPLNYEWIRRMCHKYPRAKLLLDHAARGFHAPNTVEGVKRISGLDNVYFDTSCICEPIPLIAILQEFGADRLMYGSDFPLSVVRGKTLTLGDGFIWLEPRTVNWNEADNGKPSLIGLESLRAVRDAARILNLSKTEVENIFYHTAMNMLNG